jgi:hypothetical protein
VHAARFTLVIDAVLAITSLERVTLTTIGRAFGRTTPRHGIKRCDRLLGNNKLHSELRVWYGALAEFVIGRLKRVVILVDWTQAYGDIWTLTAAATFEGRSIPVLSRSFPKRYVGNAAIQEAFLRELRRAIPSTCNAVIVADAGFRSKFFTTCDHLGFAFVIRVRNSRGVAWVDGRRVTFADLFAGAADKAQCLGGAAAYASSPHGTRPRLVLGPKPKTADLRQRFVGDYERSRAAEPFLLQTNLENESAESIVAIYRMRMQIEESFRDTKDWRFGWALGRSKTTTPRRSDVLTLLVSLALVVVTLLGAAAADAGIEKSLRASSRAARVLSFVTIGRLLCRLDTRVSIRWTQLTAVLRRLRQIHRSAFPPIAPPISDSTPVALPISHALFCVDCGWRGHKFGWPP